jgi:oligoendopeptidase F
VLSPSFADDPKERSEIAAEYKWDLSSMYASNQAWEADKEKFESMLPEIGKFKGHLADDGKTLLAAIKKIEEVNLIVENLYVYAGLSSFEDLREGDNNARFSEARTLYANLGEEVAFFSPELLAIPEEKLAQLIDDTPGLDMYRHSIDETLRLRAYTLSETEEKILAAASDPLGKFGSTFSALDNADMTFGEMQDEEGNSVELTRARYGTFIYSPNRQVREDAWKGLFTEYEKLGNTLAANYEGHVKGRVFLARTRGYDSALQAATYNSAIPEEVYLNLIKASREGSEQLQRYLELRKKALGVETLEVWDLYAPIIEPTMKGIAWDDAKKIVADALQPLGPEYVDLYWKGFDDGWVDVFETKGKRGGAYSWGTYSSKPYLSMNYEGTLNDVSTLAHEYGHSVHSYLTRGTQPYVYGGYRTFIAEVASMTNEAILYQKMLKEAESKQEKIFLLQTYLDRFRGSFFRQTSFADFEMQAHAMVESGSGLTKESLNQLYAEVFSAYYGDAVNTDPLNASEWSRIPHFLRSDNFYVYQYATSFAAATALAKMILEEGEPARERFLTMLKSGSNDYPIELLKKAGVDMTTPQPIYDTLAVFEELVNELEQNLE